MSLRVSQLKGVLHDPPRPWRMASKRSEDEENDGHRRSTPAKGDKKARPLSGTKSPQVTFKKDLV